MQQRVVSAWGYSGSIDVQEIDEETRWYRIQLDRGPYTTGQGFQSLLECLRRCVQAADNFTVTWYDTADEAYEAGSGKKNRNGLLRPSHVDRNTVRALANFQARRTKLGNPAVGLPDRVLDEEST